MDNAVAYASSLLEKSRYLDVWNPDDKIFYKPHGEWVSEEYPDFAVYSYESGDRLFYRLENMPFRLEILDYEPNNDETIMITFPFLGERRMTMNHSAFKETGGVEDTLAYILNKSDIYEMVNRESDKSFPNLPLMLLHADCLFLQAKDAIKEEPEYTKLMPESEFSSKRIAVPLWNSVWNENHMGLDVGMFSSPTWFLKDSLLERLTLPETVLME